MEQLDPQSHHPPFQQFHLLPGERRGLPKPEEESERKQLRPLPVALLLPPLPVALQGWGPRLPPLPVALRGWSPQLRVLPGPSP